MSIITLQVGQCGNQIGYQFFDTLVEDINHKNHQGTKSGQEYKQESLKRFFRDQDFENFNNKDNLIEARAVCVDTEGKVIQRVGKEAKKSGIWCYPTGQQFSERRGAGNNWADGFFRHGAEVETTIQNLIQRELEYCDYFGGILSLMSIAGGTGSGVGTRLTHVISDTIPKAFVVNALVLPHGAGEVIVQNYNAVLSLAHIYEKADALLTFGNDNVKRIAQSISESPSKVTFLDLNKVICNQLCQTFQPCAFQNSPQLACLGDFLHHLVPHKDYKLLTASSVPQTSDAALPFSTFKWQPLVKRAHQMVVSGRIIEEGLTWHNTPSEPKNKSLANLLVNRGKGADSVETSLFETRSMYPQWVPGSCGFQLCNQSQPYGGYEKSCAILSNCQIPVSCLDSIVRKAWDMFAMRAYTHWYTRYGLSDENFIDSFGKVEQILSSYKHL